MPKQPRFNFPSNANFYATSSVYLAVALGRGLIDARKLVTSLQWVVHKPSIKPHFPLSERHFSPVISIHQCGMRRWHASSPIVPPPNDKTWSDRGKRWINENDWNGGLRTWTNEPFHLVSTNHVYWLELNTPNQWGLSGWCADAPDCGMI